MKRARTNSSSEHSRHRRIGAIARVLTALVVIALCAATGGAIALRASDEGVYTTSAGQLNVDVRPAWHGQVEMFVPIVDWELTANAYDAPVTLTIEARSIHRSTALNTLENPRDADTTIKTFRAQARDVIRQAVHKAVIASAIGFFVGALFGAGLVAAITLRRRWLVIGPIEGCVVAIAVIVPILLILRSMDQSSFEDPKYSANGSEVPSLLAFAQQLLVVGGEYKGHYDEALKSVSNVLKFSERASTNMPGAGKDHSIVLGSDIHNNVFVLDAFKSFAKGDPVVLAGDFGQVGAKIEQRMAPEIADIGPHVYAVSGNHDSQPFMAELAQDGVTVLDSDSAAVSIDGLHVVGYDDPLEGKADDDSHTLRVYGAAYQRQVQHFLDWFDALPDVPDVVVVHQHGFGKRLLEHLHERGIEHVTVLVGHDHKAHVEQLGTNVMVDGGTLGAGGPFAIGEQDASFARVHFRGHRAYAADIVAIEPLSGRAVARRIVFAKTTSQLTDIKVNTKQG